MKRIISIVLSLGLALNIMVLPISAKATETTNSQNRQAVLNYLDNSYVKKFATNPKGAEAYEKIKRNAVNVTTSDSYIKIDTTGVEKTKSYTQNEYNKQVSRRDNMSSDSGNRYSWIKLTVEAYDFGNNDFMFCGFYDWITVPFFTGTDVLTLGHDASISFNTDTAFGFTQTTYEIMGEQHVESTNFNFAESKKDTTTDAAGVGFKFKLFPTGGADNGTRKYTGAIYCNGWINNSFGGNLQVSYGHSEITLGSIDLETNISWESNGAIKFNVTGTQDIATHGNAVRY